MVDCGTVLSLVSQWRRLGERVFADGSISFGHIPHVAPHAWLHTVFAPLLAEDSAHFLRENRAVEAFPYTRSLDQFNGADLYSGKLVLYGVPKGTNTPFDIATYNYEEPDFLKAGRQIVGRFLSQKILQDRQGLIFLTAPTGKNVDQYADLESFLRDKCNALNDCFDDQGVEAKSRGRR